jgi:hypothetical protein
MKKPKFERTAPLDFQRSTYPKEQKYNEYSSGNDIYNKEMKTRE